MTGGTAGSMATVQGMMQAHFHGPYVSEHSLLKVDAPYLQARQSQAPQDPPTTGEEWVQNHGEPEIRESLGSLAQARPATKRQDSCEGLNSSKKTRTREGRSPGHIWVVH